MKRRRRRLWTEFETEVLRLCYSHARAEAIAQYLGRHVQHVYSKARKLGLEKARPVWNKGLKGYDAGGGSHERHDGRTIKIREIYQDHLGP